MTKTLFCEARSCAKLVLTNQEHRLPGKVLYGQDVHALPVLQMFEPQTCIQKEIVVPREDYFISSSHQQIFCPPSPCFGLQALCKNSGFHHYQQRAPTPGRCAWPRGCTPTAIPWAVYMDFITFFQSSGVKRSVHRVFSAAAARQTSTLHPVLKPEH